MSSSVSWISAEGSVSSGIASLPILAIRQLKLSHWVVRISGDSGVGLEASRDRGDFRASVGSPFEIKDLFFVIAAVVAEASTPRHATSHRRVI